MKNKFYIEKECPFGVGGGAVTKNKFVNFIFEINVRREVNEKRV